MSILIKGMDMPKSCRKCKFCVDLNDYPFKMCFLTETELPLDADNLEDCPLIEIDDEVLATELPRLERLTKEKKGNRWLYEHTD